MNGRRARRLRRSPRRTREGRRRGKLAPLVKTLALLLPVTAGHAAKMLQRIEPGPTKQSPQELAIKADPARGVEHAVILTVHYERNEDLGVFMETSHHVRAKILSNEGRDLANIEIPIFGRGARLVKWWGRTIQPDGQVIEVAKEDLDRQFVARSTAGKIEAVKAALPGVVPGSVIDFGYVVRKPGWVRFDSIPLQRRYPIEHFRYAWRPYRGFRAAYYLNRAEKLDLKTENRRGVVVIEGRNAPPARIEPLMPALNASRGVLYLYYVPIGTRFETYWRDVARARSNRLEASSRKRSVAAALEVIAPAPEGDLDARLEAVYDWIGRNVTRTDLLSFEEERADEEEARERNDIVRQVMESRMGSAYELDVFFLALARGLGAEANLVFAVDRTDDYWNPEVRTMRQFSSTLVAVGPRGAGTEELTVVDPGCGMRYGQVPWWLAGVSGMMVTKGGSESIAIPFQRYRASLLRTRADLSYADDNELLEVEWSSEATGQAGMSALRELRRLSPSERERWIQDLCSTGSDAEVLGGEISDIEALSDRLELRCEVEGWSDLDEDVGSLQIGFRGPWIRGIPDLPDEERLHPVVLHHPHYEDAVVTLRAPAGFAPAEAPDPVALDTEFGLYRLVFKQTDTGFEVQRQLALTLPGVPSRKYADLRRFFESVRRHDRSAVVFERRGSGG